MIKLIAITLSLILSVLIFSLSSWFEQEEIKIESMNKKHLQDIEKIKKIDQLNSWLDTKVEARLKVVPNSVDEVDKHFIKYFDKNSKRYNFLIKKYIYKDENVKKFDISYKINRNSKEDLINFMHLNYKDGFLEFKSYKLDKESLVGELQLIEFYKEDHNETK